MNSQLVIKLIQKRLTFPFVAQSNGKSGTLARQLDIALMENGFKLSGNLLKHLSGLAFEDALVASQLLLAATKELVGAHVKHNTYFINFPKNVPDTLEFWGRLLAKHYEEGGEFTDNLLDFSTYGTYQHTYEEMLERHDTWRGKVKLKVVNLGKTEREELEGMYAYLAGSNVPLNEEDRKLLADLYGAGFAVSVKIPVRENKAVVNALRLSGGIVPLDVDTPVDVLRLAAYLSGGDVTLLENTRFKSFKRPVRRELLGALATVLCDESKLEDINRYKEQFKRLARVLHPHEYAKQFPVALKAFDFAGGKLDFQTWGSKVNDNLNGGSLTKAISLLAEKPGYFVRSLDKLSRDASDLQFLKIKNTFKDKVGAVSGRVLLSLAEHLDNRSQKPEARIFVNRAGRGWAQPNNLERLLPKRIAALQSIVWKELERRVPVKSLVINDDVAKIAVPLSEKTKSEGFRVLPRGSIIDLEPGKNVLRFFVYWHQTADRTDYDLSAALFDKDFNFIDQLSWTQLRGDFGCHSGDITDAPKGATEFIDINLTKVASNVFYIVPTINCFTGEPFSKCREAFMGFMLRDTVNRGAPFEAKSVQTKFALRGEQNGVGVPMTFMRTEAGWSAKWLDLYSRGMPWGNRVEANKYSTALLAKTIIAKDYLTMGRLLDLYRAKGRVYTAAKAPDGATYIGMELPEGVKADEVYTLDNLKALIPA